MNLRSVGEDIFRLADEIAISELAWCMVRRVMLAYLSEANVLSA